MECSVMNEVKIVRAGLPAWHELAPYHYRSHRLGVVRQIWAALWRPRAQPDAPPRTAGVLVVTMPVLNCALRDIATAGRYAIPDKRRRARQINRELRCIARVVIHPTFRGMGLAVRLVRHALAHAGTPYVEALAAMGRINPMFEHAGMRRYERPLDAAAARMVQRPGARRLAPGGTVRRAGVAQGTAARVAGRSPPSAGGDEALRRGGQGATE